MHSLRVQHFGNAFVVVQADRKFSIKSLDTKSQSIQDDGQRPGVAECESPRGLATCLSDCKRKKGGS